MKIIEMPMFQTPTAKLPLENSSLIFSVVHSDIGTPGNDDAVNTKHGKT